MAAMANKLVEPFHSRFDIVEDLALFGREKRESEREREAREKSS